MKFILILNFKSTPNACEQYRSDKLSSQSRRKRKRKRCEASEKPKNQIELKRNQN